MTTRPPARLALAITAIPITLVVTGCQGQLSGETSSLAARDDAPPMATDPDGGAPRAHDADDAGTGTRPIDARDASVMLCGPDSGIGAPPPETSGECTPGTATPGCPCDSVGEARSCLTGRTITCEPYGEFGGLWGPCLGECFSSGNWFIENVSPCIVPYSGGRYGAVSTIIRDGEVACPDDAQADDPPPLPAEDWSGSTLTVDCEGQFTLCYTLKAGRREAPSPSDCVIAEVCTESWYGERNATQTLPPLPAWTSGESACIAEFATTGGYAEMSVIGTTIDCETIDDDRGGRYVFTRIGYCAPCCGGSCADEPRCDGCAHGGRGGSF